MWQAASRYASYLWNRTKISKRTDMTPFQAMSGRTPSILHTGVFGCDAWVHQDRSQRDTSFDAKAKPGIYLGHDANQRCAMVYMLESRKTIRTRDVDLREGSFDFMRAYRKGRGAEVAQQDYTPWSTTLSESEITSWKSTADADADEKSADEEEAVTVTEQRHNPRQEWEVHGILEHRGSGKKLEYLVDWGKEYDPSWQPAKNLKSAPKMVKEYHQAVKTAAVATAAPAMSGPTTRSKAVTWPDEAKAETEEKSDDDDDGKEDDTLTVANEAARMALKAMLGCRCL
jgi:hypothetical protein